MILTEKMLEKFAGDIVGRFFGEKIALNDGVTDVAQSENLNHEQIKRLVEAVNTTAFLQKFNNPEPDANGRVVEFETANPGAVINRMLDGAKDEMNQVQTPQDVDTTTHIDNELPVTRADEAPDLPDASEPTDGGDTKMGEARPQKYAVINRLHKTAEFLREQEYQARNDLTDALQKLATAFRRTDNPSFEEFEKDAFYQYGPPAVPYLRLVRATLRKPNAEYDYAGMQKHARYVDTQTTEMGCLRTMIKAYDVIVDCQKGRKKVGEHLARIA
jgi:hypothetical protein